MSGLKSATESVPDSDEVRRLPTMESTSMPLVA